MNYYHNVYYIINIIIISRDLPTGIMCDFVDIDIDTITLGKMLLALAPWTLKEWLVRG